MIAGIDIGSHKITTLIGEALPGRGVRVLGAGHAPAEGIRAGEIVHVEDAAGAIAASLERAERLAGEVFDRAFIGLTGAHLDSRLNAAVVPCARRPRPMAEEDVQRALEAAGTVPIAPEREMLHVLPRAFRLDGGSRVDSPVGMEGCQLEADVLIVGGATATLNNLRTCLDMAEVDRYRLVFSTLAAGDAVLTDDERELGVALVDLGHAMTGLACYDEGSVAHAGTIPIGGRHMTSDLAVVLQTPLEQAERIKKTHGHVLPEHDDEATEIEVTPFGADEPRVVRRRLVSEVLAARADELSRLVAERLAEAGFAEPPAGVVLVGGGTELKGLARRLHEGWGLPVRIGRPRQVAGLTSAASGADHAAAVGLLGWAGRAELDVATLPGAGAPAGGGVAGVVAWLRQTMLPRHER